MKNMWWRMGLVMFDISGLHSSHCKKTSKDKIDEQNMSPLADKRKTRFN